MKMPGINFRLCPVHLKKGLTEREDSTDDHSATDIPLEQWHSDKLNKHPQERQKGQEGGGGGGAIKTTGRKDRLRIRE